MGVELKRNVKDAWWRSIVQERDDIIGMDTSILMNPKVWEASGHVASFSDPLVECKACHLRWKADDLTETKCPSCSGELTEERMFNTMFKTFIGPVEEDAAVVYLRPETAQGMFVNFPNALSTGRKRLPFGIAQQGKAFRNEITTGNFIFRSREFEIMEFEYFIKPGTQDKWFEYWLNERYQWYQKLGIKTDHLKLHHKKKEELAHYALAATDIEYDFPMGWGELEGIASRGDFDLTQHASTSGKSMEYYDDETKERYVPYVVEPSVGVDRAILVFLCDAYDEEPDKDEIRVVLHFHPDIAPIKVAVLPLSRKENLAAFARDVYKDLRPCFATQYDDTQSIGRRYRRQDELGTPYCVTLDFQSLEDNMATIRERDSMHQIRVPVPALKNTLLAKLAGEDLFVLPEGGKIWKQG
ncbi:MAG: glycine--tRNA ligase [Chloroflexi bacterium RBG_13_57_8]|nr:MAG: glycine--tRNA ligase [Chloroflexi bacterium RBG_13_57_8]